MRRVTLIVAAVAVGAVTVVVITGSRSPADYRVAAIFDTSGSATVGSRVKIAGVPVGSVESIEIAPGPKARIVMSVPRRFAPFHVDATCRILPEGILSESYVECVPGSTRQRPLTGATPTVPVTRTTVPLSLQTMLNVFRAPTNEHLRLLFDELGIATAGQGENINAILRRANPALTQTRRLMDILNAQSAHLETGITQFDRVLGAVRGKDVRRFVDSAAGFASATAAEQHNVQASIRRLPPLLRAARPGLAAIDAALANGRPLLARLRRSAPALLNATHTVPALMASATPVLQTISSVSDAARPALRAAKPLVKGVDAASRAAAPFSPALNDFLISFRDRGGIEGLMALIYGLANDAAGFDSVSHMVGQAVPALPARCLVQESALGCSAKYDAPGNGIVPANAPSCGPQPGAVWDPPSKCTATLSPLPRKARLPVRKNGNGSGPRTPTRPAPEPKAPTPILRAPTPRVPTPTPAVPDALHELLDYLLGP